MAIFTNTKGVLNGTPKVFIAIPTYSGKLDARLVHSLLETIPLFQKEGIGFEFQTLSYSCHVDDARNELVRRFRESDCDSLIFIDADVSWRPESLARLVKHDRDVVAGVYPKRSIHDTDFPVLVEGGVELWADQDGLVEVLGAPTGFMKIKRHVIEKLAALNSAKKYLDRRQTSDDIPNVIIFERTLENSQRYSGDYAFCLAWRKLGGKIFVDPELRLAHKGEVEFEGTLGNYWREKHGVTGEWKAKQFKEAIEKLKAGNPSESDFITLFEAWGNAFAASPSLLAACYWLAKEKKGSVLEAGSGLTTLVMALANPELTIHCLEHEIIWATKIKNEMRALGLNNIVMHLVDFKPYQSGKFYDTSSLPKENFSIALLDGPPRKLGSRSVFFECLGEQITDAVVLMDDADNDADVIPIQEWARAHGRGDVKVLGEARRFVISTKVG